MVVEYDRCGHIVREDRACPVANARPETVFDLCEPERIAWRECLLCGRCQSREGDSAGPPLAQPDKPEKDTGGASPNRYPWRDSLRTTPPDDETRETLALLRPSVLDLPPEQPLSYFVQDIAAESAPHVSTLLPRNPFFRQSLVKRELQRPKSSGTIEQTDPLESDNQGSLSRSYRISESGRAPPLALASFRSFSTCSRFLFPTAKVIHSATPAATPW